MSEETASATVDRPAAFSGDGLTDLQRHCYNLRHRDPVVRGNAAWALSGYRCSEAVEALGLLGLSDTSSFRHQNGTQYAIQIVAAWALGEIGTPDIVAPLSLALHNDRKAPTPHSSRELAHDYRLTAFSNEIFLSLGKVNDAAVYDAYALAMESAYPAVRLAAIKRLEGSGRFVDLLFKALLDKRPEIHKAAAQAIRNHRHSFLWRLQVAPSLSYTTRKRWFRELDNITDEKLIERSFPGMVILALLIFVVLAATGVVPLPSLGLLPRASTNSQPTGSIPKAIRREQSLRQPNVRALLPQHTKRVGIQRSYNEQPAK